MSRARPVLYTAVLLAGCRFDPNGLAADGDGGVVTTPDGRPGGTPDAPPGAPDAMPGMPDAQPLTPDAMPQPRGYRRAITIHADKVGGALTDFPVYVSLSGDAGLQAHARSSGSDVHFTAADGVTALDHELQHWDRNAGLLQAWVRVPALDDTTDTVIYLVYGDPGAAVAQNPAGVWKNGFVAVWHLEQAPSNQAGAIIDSLGLHHGSTGGGLNANDLVSAALGDGLLFNGGGNEVTFSNPLAGASPHTISAWVDQGATNDNDALVVLGNGACEQARWLHTRFDSGNVAAGFYCDDWTNTGVSVVGGGFTLLHWTYDGGGGGSGNGGNGKSRLYRDGALVAGPFTHMGNPFTMGATGRLGNAPAAFGSNMGLHAVVDEVHIANVARAPEWVATEFANQSDPPGFCAVGAEEPVF